MLHNEKVYKNIMFLYAFILISLFCIIYYLYYININLQLDLKILTKDRFYSYYQFETFLLIFFALATLLLSQYFQTQIIKSKALRTQSRTELEIINTLYKELQSFHTVKEVSNNALDFLLEQFGASKGKLYIVDYQNEQLYLSGVSNMKIRDEEQVLEIYRGTMGEVVAFQKVKYIKTKSYYKVLVPIINNNKTIATIILYLDRVDDDFVISQFHNTLIKIISDFLQKELNNEQNRKYFDLIDNYVIISNTNKDGIINYSSKAFENILGYEKNELIGKSHNIIRSPRIKNELFSTMWKNISSGKIWHSEIENIKKDKTNCWLKTTIQPDFDYYGNIVGYTAVRVDITDKKIIEKISITDAMTNIYNRRYFDKIFPKRINLAKRLDKKLAFCMMDIDHFKQYNDTYGHQDGDTTLIKVAYALKESLKREDDFVFRLGGEEFGMLYFVDNKDDAFNIAENTRKAIEDIKIPHEKNSASPYVTVSMGLYIFNQDKILPKEIYLAADKLLYKSKQNGRNQIKINTIKDK